MALSTEDEKWGISLGSSLFSSLILVSLFPFVICVCTRNVNLTMLYTLKGIFFFLVWSFTRLLGVVFVNSVSHHRNNKKGNFIAYLQFCRRN